ncbi:hypothetical protein N7474_009221 [Penicillium riverlandense]|uniref:uncharacterized protein n=1 Tax=Penicillium riverlandense TaxID=1903569 RepID=UPI0025468903|nr:uncharacterized protein N7474_009221 [Penicillium riverlandense]KAJ5807952.1 hypothetical protein N7474_009221 [Penicillium riverlandense]
MATMGTAERITIPTNVPSTGIFEVRPLMVETATKASELLQRNHDNYHIYIHNLGLHNHILHHLLAIYALGGTPCQLENAYNLATDSQRPTRNPDINRVLDFTDPAKFKKCLGKGKYYDDYFLFFQREIGRNGVPNTVNDFLFKGDERAEDMLRRFFGGFLHSPIHLGYAIEFNQPLVAAEALALTAIHDASFGDILELIEKNAPLSPASESLIGLQLEIYSNQKFRHAMDYKHGVFQIQNGLLANAREEFLRVVGSWRVRPQELDEKTAEHLNASLYWTGLAQRPEKQIRIDFFLMHSITAGSFWPVLNSAPWISPTTKCRLLEWKGRSDLILYCQTGAPLPRPEELAIYQPQQPSGWQQIFQRACDYKDDGHLSKLIRGIATAAEISKAHVKNPKFKLTTDREFLTLAHMAMDSAEQFNRHTGTRETDMIRERYQHVRTLSMEIQRVTARWPRHVGFEQAWFHVPDRKSVGLSHL